MNELNLKREYRTLEKLVIKDKEKDFAKDSGYVTRYIYTGNSTIAKTLDISEDQHSSQRQRYYNSRRDV